MVIRRIIKHYYEKFYAHKFGNIDEMDQFCERHKLTQEKDNFGRPMSIEKFESMINKLPKQKVAGSAGVTGELPNI